MASKTQRCSVAEAPLQVPGQRDGVILPWRHIIDDAVRAERGGEERRLAGHPGQSGLSCGRFTGLSVDSERARARERERERERERMYFR